MDNPLENWILFADQGSKIYHLADHMHLLNISLEASHSHLIFQRETKITDAAVRC